jgi:DNA-binding NarL/FixJ family response regulator
MGMTGAPRKIQVIEDDRESVALIVDELVERGFEVIVAHDGHQGFVSILKNRPDLVLCDISLPIMSGFEILEHLGDLAPQIGRMPFVFLTALADRDNELRARRLGADDYVAKPVDFEILEAIINARLAGVARNDIWPRLADLNDREIETLTWLARGKTTAEIADIFGLARRTIDFHLESARTKLGVSTRTEAAVKAVFGGLIKP